MSMFERYDNLNPDYIPDNSTPVIDFVKQLDSELPLKMYDSKYRHIGYRWNASDRFDTQFSVADTIRVSADAVIYRTSGQAPDMYTTATREGQKAYNTVDRKSWTFVGKTEDAFIWVQDDTFIYPVRGVVPLTLEHGIENARAKLCIYNFRWELIKEIFSDIDESSVHFTYDDEMAQLLKSGVYYAVLYIVTPDDIILKNRFYLLVE